MSQSAPSTAHDPLAAAKGSAAPPPPAIAELAAVLPDLEILGLLGQGGMGAVYRVRRRSDGATLALKVVRPRPGQEDAFAARFAREAEALSRLQHPHIVAIHGHGRSGPWCWLLMDLVEGANLREIVATGRLSPAQTLALVPPLCTALQYAHDQGVVHRDLKPENILLDAAGVPHLVDFGLAKLRDGEAGSGLTNTGAAMGTVHYMAPEQVASAKGVDHRADIYALGVVIYELLTGQLPLGRFEAPSQRVQVDVRIDEVVLKALERDPERRWQQMRLVGEAVSAAETTPSAKAKINWIAWAVEALSLGIFIAAWFGATGEARRDILTGCVVLGLAIPLTQLKWAVQNRWNWLVIGICALAVVLGGVLVFANPHPAGDPPPAAITTPSMPPTVVTPAPATPVAPPAAAHPDDAPTSGIMVNPKEAPLATLDVGNIHLGDVKEEYPTMDGILKDLPACLRKLYPDVVQYMQELGANEGKLEPSMAIVEVTAFIRARTRFDDDLKGINDDMIRLLCVLARVRRENLDVVEAGCIPFLQKQRDILQVPASNSIEVAKFVFQQKEHLPKTLTAGKMKTYVDLLTRRP